jgi:hypothetical protein
LAISPVRPKRIARFEFVDEVIPKDLGGPFALPGARAVTPWAACSMRVSTTLVTELLSLRVASKLAVVSSISSVICMGKVKLGFGCAGDLMRF